MGINILEQINNIFKFLIKLWALKKIVLKYENQVLTKYNKPIPGSGKWKITGKKIKSLTHHRRTNETKISTILTISTIFNNL